MEEEHRGVKVTVAVTDDRWSNFRVWLVYLQVAEETAYIQAPLLRVPVLVWTDVFKASVGKHSIVIF